MIRISFHRLCLRSDSDVSSSMNVYFRYVDKVITIKLSRNTVRRVNGMIYEGGPIST